MIFMKIMMVIFMKIIIMIRIKMLLVSKEDFNGGDGEMIMIKMSKVVRRMMKVMMMTMKKVIIKLVTII